MDELRIELNLTSCLNTLRIQAVKELLSDNTLSQEQIAVRCGFVSAATMRRVFRSIEPCTPGQYRTRNGKQTAI